MSDTELPHPEVSPAQLERQRARLAEFEAEAADLVERVTERSWRQCRREIVSMVESGFAFSFQDPTTVVTMLAQHAHTAFSDAFDALVLPAFERLQRAWTELGVDEPIDINLMQLEVLRWMGELSDRLHSELDYQLRNADEMGAGTVVGLALKKLWSDDSFDEARDRFDQKREQRKRRLLMDVDLTWDYRRKARQLIEQGCAAYRKVLEQHTPSA